MHIHNFPKNLYMHFLGWPGISKICIFLGKMHIFQDPGLEKKCIYTFFPKKIGKIPPICIFPRKMHIFVAQTLTQKMHIHLWCFFGGEKMHIHNFPKNLYMHFLGWPGISKICIFLGKMHIFQDPGLEKNVYQHFSKKMEHFHRYTFGMFFWGDINHIVTD